MPGTALFYQVFAPPQGPWQVLPSLRWYAFVSNTLAMNAQKGIIKFFKIFMINSHKFHVFSQYLIKMTLSFTSILA